MNALIDACKQGDWVVHMDYGVGQVRGIEKKTLAGDTKKYLRVKTSDSSFWVPINSSEHLLVRPIATEEQVREALKVFRQPPTRMSRNYRVRRQRIEEDSHDGDLCSDAELIRDLTARKYAKGINHWDKTSLERLQKRFIGEWSVILDLAPEIVQGKLETLLEQCRLS